MIEACVSLVRESSQEGKDRLRLDDLFRVRFPSL